MLSVDGMLAEGPNLSHWPGNRTPPGWKDDLSTGICMRFARAEKIAQERFLGETDAVTNDHYDTDGLMSLLAVLHPDVALTKEEVCLAAAGAGDFQRMTTPRGFAIDRIVAKLARPESPVGAAFEGLQGPEKDLARYQWLLSHIEDVLAPDPAFAPLWQEECAEVIDQIQWARAGAAQRRMDQSAALATVVCDAPMHRMALNTVAGAFRVLHAQPVGRGQHLIRYHDRTETWFEVATFCPPPRVDLDRARARLADAEPERDGARWCCDPPTEPIPELYFGVPSAQQYGQVTRELRPSRLPLDGIVDILADELALTHGPETPPRPR